jgi:lipoprotein-releasing system ATP-binding protein
MEHASNVKLLYTEKLTKVFRSGSSDLVVLDSIDFALDAGEMVAIVGESGSGKSTMLQTLGTLDTSTSGEIYFKGVAYSSLSETEKVNLRNQNFGFVWQQNYLLPEFTAVENAAMPLRIRGMRGPQTEKVASKWLERVGLADRKTHRAGELSGGEQQRVALARALVSDPKVLMADEPTGSLDARNGELIAELIEELHREYQMSTILVTHNLSFAQRCDRVLKLENGKLEAVSFSQTMR